MPYFAFRLFIVIQRMFGFQHFDVEKLQYERIIQCRETIMILNIFYTFSRVLMIKLFKHLNIGRHIIYFCLMFSYSDGISYSRNHFGLLTYYLFSILEVYIPWMINLFCILPWISFCINILWACIAICDVCIQISNSFNSLSILNLWSLYKMILTYD